MEKNTETQREIIRKQKEIERNRGHNRWKNKNMQENTWKQRKIGRNIGKQMQQRAKQREIDEN